ncbi:MAG: hypothetical protein WA979_07750 [Pacificimonas sp.]
MKTVAIVMFCLVGLVNLLPVMGTISGDRIQTLYSVTLTGPDLSLLMRHRALLFGIVGGLLLAGAFRPELRLAAAIAGFVSMGGFILIALTEQGVNDALRQGIVIDAVAIVLLAAGLVIFQMQGELT